MTLNDLPVEISLIDGEWYQDVAGGVYYYEAEGRILSNGKITVQSSSSPVWYRMVPGAQYHAGQPEPPYPAAIIRAADGRVGIRVLDKDSQHWRMDDMTWATWDEIPKPAKVISNGVRP